MTSFPTALYLTYDHFFPEIYGEAEQRIIAARTNLLGPPLTPDTWQKHPEWTTNAGLLFSGWGLPVMDEDFLERFPRLKVVFYGSGSIKKYVTEPFWDRGIQITSAYAANAVPVVEYTLSQILWCLKQGWQNYTFIRQHGHFPPGRWQIPAGAYRATVGIISLGMIGQMIVKRLAAFDVNIIAYDPYFSPERARELGVSLVSLEELFESVDVVSCHMPSLRETQKILTENHFAAMKPGTSFINTSRGAVVDEDGLASVLRRRPDLFAVLDVTEPEPPVSGSPLYTLSNVALTPHIAGSMGAECRRMGQTMIQELDRHLAGEPLRWAITREQARIMA